MSTSTPYASVPSSRIHWSAEETRTFAAEFAKLTINNRTPAGMPTLSVTERVQAAVEALPVSRRRKIIALGTSVDLERAIQYELAELGILRGDYMHDLMRRKASRRWEMDLRSSAAETPAEKIRIQPVEDVEPVKLGIVCPAADTMIRGIVAMCAHLREVNPSGVQGEAYGDILRVDPSVQWVFGPKFVPAEPPSVPVNELDTASVEDLLAAISLRFEAVSKPVEVAEEAATVETQEVAPYHPPAVTKLQGHRGHAGLFRPNPLSILIMGQAERRWSTFVAERNADDGHKFILCDPDQKGAYGAMATAGIDLVVILNRVAHSATERLVKAQGGKVPRMLFRTSESDQPRHVLSPSQMEKWLEAYGRTGVILPHIIS